MKQRPPRKRRPKYEPGRDTTRDIDVVYGLEPVIEPVTSAGASETSGGTRIERTQCPYCGENFETMVDLSGGSSTYIEDCQVCCQPIEFTLDVDPIGKSVTLTARRGD